MKFIHLINRNHPSLTTRAISFLSQEYFQEKHSLCTISYFNKIRDDVDTNGIQNFDIKNSRSIISFLKLYKHLDKYDVVVLHGMYINRWGMVLLMLLKPGLLKKIVWIGFGQDIYEFDYRKSNSVFEKFKLKVFLKCYKRIKAFIGIFPPDVEIFNKRISNSIPSYYAPYTYSNDTYFNQEYIKHDCLVEKYKLNKPIKILIGHRGAEFFNHKKWINELKRFKGNNIQIYIPLGGASESYIKEIKTIASSETDLDIIVFDKFIPYNQLIDLSKNIDIAIFDSNFQVALGTMYLLFFHGVKIYLPSTSIMYKTFKEKNIPIKNLDIVNKIDFYNFIEDVDMKPAYDYVKHIKNFENSILLWQQTFEQIEAQSKK